MTIAEAKAKLVSWCNEQVSYSEVTNNYNKYTTPKWATFGFITFVVLAQV